MILDHNSVTGEVDIATPPAIQQNGNHKVRGFVGSTILSILLAVFLLGGLIHLGGIWNIIANTRLLRLLIDSGIVKYHDRDAGFIEGVADHVYYMKSQEYVEWSVVFLALLVLLGLWALRAFQFHDIMRYHGISGSFGQHARAYLTRLAYTKITPLYTGDAAALTILQEDGASPRRVYSALFLVRLFLIFEITIFAIFGLLGIGWSAWLLQVFWASVLFGVMYWWTRSAPVAGNRTSRFTAARQHLAELLERPLRLLKVVVISIVAFGLEDVAAYLLIMAFSTQEVLLHVSFDLILMAFVAGYIARFIPLTPGGIGQFEVGFVAALFLGGIGLPEAVTVALLYSFFYYLSLAIVYLVTISWRGVGVPLRPVLKALYYPSAAKEDTKAALATHDEEENALIAVPEVASSVMPPAVRLWQRGLVIAWVVLGLFFVDRLTLLLSDLWLMESLGYSQVFWTNFNMGAALFILGGLAFMVGVALPALLHPIPNRTRRVIMGIAGLVGLVAGYLLLPYYQEYLLWLNGLPFGESDPVFNRDFSFYFFTLPALWVTWWAMLWLCLVTLLSSLFCASLSRQGASAYSSRSRISEWLGTVSTGPTLGILSALGVVIALGIWLNRYDLLLKEDYMTSVFTGASYIDVNGLFSVLNQIQFTAFVALCVTVALVMLLRALNQRSSGVGNGRLSNRVRMASVALALFIGADLAFAAMVGIRNTIVVKPNQPVIQLPYIERHIAATRQAYGLDHIEEIEFIPRHGDDPVLDLDIVLSSNIMRNAPLWPTFVSYLERVVDPQHSQRILQTRGDAMIYGPTLEIFRQKEKLRTYYDFMDVDVLRYNINGEKTVFASAVRELPIMEPQPWLAWWGQRFMLFTHGHGLVMSPIGAVTPEGNPSFVSNQIPVQAAYPEITTTNPQVYYGEGSASMAVSNVRDMAELDYPTEQGRAEIILPLDVPAGVPVDSLLKRFVFGWRSGEFWEMTFSTLITPETRVHYFRQPLQRLERVAPFLYYEANPYATIVEGDITWLVNAITISDQYPYSRHQYIGDKSHSRSPEVVTTERINYAEDSVKATINAATGQMQFYKIADAPVINTWAAIYPSLFTDGGTMPQEVRQQLTYPLHLFHTQFDDLYIYYHMNDPIYFFNMEDMWDDADEVLGPVLDQGRAITFSIEPYHMIVETGSPLPESSEREQFVLAMPFTPEGARNLRALPMVYQDGDDYGRIFVLMIPKGLFITGPEQADAIIDQNPEISEQISWWNRMGTDVIRGHTSLLLIDNEVIYVEPMFIRSQQNSITQLKRVIIVLRGQAYMAASLDQALRLAYSSDSGGAVVTSIADDGSND